MHKLRNAPGDTEADLKAQLEKIAMKSKVYVLGLGNTDRADDGAGVIVAEALKKHFPVYSYSEHDGVEGTVLDISEKKQDAVVFFVDASELRSYPGAVRIVRREDIKDTEITTHRVAVALMASIIDKSEKRVAVICIQPATIQFRGKMSSQVRETIDMLVRVLGDMMKSQH